VYSGVPKVKVGKEPQNPAPETSPVESANGGSEAVTDVPADGQESRKRPLDDIDIEHSAAKKVDIKEQAS
jgi:hypothetical protein